MQLPFSHDRFLDVFGAYNRQWWPVALLLWIATAAVAWRWLRGPSSGRLLMSVLAVHWVWSGLAYRVPRAVAIVPILWAVVGSSAAVLLGIEADLALVVAGLALLVNAIAPSVLGPVR